jgi:hypothetical protein
MTHQRTLREALDDISQEVNSWPAWMRKQRPPIEQRG